jgi:hypothetical protein
MDARLQIFRERVVRPAGCTTESHSDLKNDSSRWAAELEVLGEMDAGAVGRLLLLNCRACRSTLAVLMGATSSSPTPRR